MLNNPYYSSYQAKPDAELKQILRDNHQYTDEALTASLQVLVDRYGLTPELETVQKNIEQKKHQKDVAKVYVSEYAEKKSYITDDPNAPEMHSKRVITVFAGVFSTIFGAALLMYNLKQEDHSTGRMLVLLFGIVYTIACIALIDWLDIPSNFVFILNLAGAYILNEFFWNRYLGKDFEYRKRSWIRPAIISVIITILILLPIFVGDM